MADVAPLVADLQERLYAEGVVGSSRRRLLLVLQGMDTSGKDGATKHVDAMINPQGLRITSFKAPTAAERRHDFLWRIGRAVPEPGYVGVFNRSQYEDVLIVRVHALVPESEWSTRYDAHQRVRARAAATTACTSSRCSCTSRRRSSRSACSPGSTTRPSTGSTTRPTWTSARSGTST